ncbi:MAG: phage head closure protein [Syntrophaceae bacterium]
MNTSELKHQITIQAPSLTPDGSGGFTTTWTAKAANIWAAIWPVSAKETIKNGQVSGEITHRIRIRYRRDVQADWRVKFGNRYFNIAAPPINPNMDNEWLDLVCKEAA